MTKINSKQKGSRGEREWANFCKDHGYEVRRTAQYCGNTGDASDCVGLDGIHQEVKRVERLNISAAMEQARNECGDNIPIVAHRKNREGWLVTMSAEDWFELYGAWVAKEEKEKEE
jgi:Holliday junction resolvase